MIRLERKWQDLWIGLYWKVENVWLPPHCGKFIGRRVHLWVCLVPCFPIHVVWIQKKQEAQTEE